MPSPTMQMQSISGIITQVHNTTGETPPPLVGASMTVVGDRVFVFAGRLVTSRKMTNYMYVLDLNTLQWTRHIPPPDSAKPPKPRYFHSADVYNNTIIVFGGMGYSRISTDGLCVLDDISIFDVETMTWRRPTVEPSLFAPRPRYAHLSAIVEDKLVVIGGQDMNNGYLGEINVLDLKTWEWVHAKSFDKHVGAYRSIAITAPPRTRLPIMLRETMGTGGVGGGGGPTSTDSPQVSAMDDNKNSAAGGTTTIDAPSPIYLYTNYNFADVKRELQLIFTPSGASSAVEDCSNYMTGSAMPPGLRFPTGHTLGHHLVLAGTYLSPQSQSFTIWALDLGTLTWSRIETGSVFTQGSWNRGVLHETTNRFVVFGHRGRNLLDDYNHRQVNFDHVAMVDMEAFGVYNLPKTTCSTLAQEMGLSLLNEPAVSDFRIITIENQSIPVNSAVLCQRWPYFEQLMKENRATVSTRKPIVDIKKDEEEENNNDETATAGSQQQPQQEKQQILKAHSMSFPYPHPVVIALLQFIYTDNLLTAQQYQPHILSQLLLLADMYELPRLRALATHALHQMLNMSTAPLIFETAALSHQTSLQVRALKMMIAAKKMIQHQQQQHHSTSPMTPRDNTFSMYAESVSGRSDGSGLGRRSQQDHGIRPSSPTSSYYRSSTASPLQRQGSEDPHMSSMLDHLSGTSPKFPPTRTRTPSYASPGSPFGKGIGSTRGVMGGVMGGQQSFSSQGYGSAGPDAYRYPGSASSPPQTPRHGSIAVPAIPETPTTAGSPGSPQPSRSTKNKKDSSKDGKKSTKEKKAFLESVGNKFSMNF
ncbi:hypothetical protein BDA99DRAFT_496109 [Phascolomyces articulosus]|uniref:BTB domain-containing protein n=1 Tax=Phascolomyces articulosus TaxID=60185 RepID=A0AAD5KTR7_9FUNG|nr:hypothetical protein BDA99DRAFT_496109 [Phascolomyces articulosus]